MAHGAVRPIAVIVAGPDAGIILKPKAFSLEAPDETVESDPPFRSVRPASPMSSVSPVNRCPATRFYSAFSQEGDEKIIPVEHDAVNSSIVEKAALSMVAAVNRSGGLLRKLWRT
jgi:hypothetical protein